MDKIKSLYELMNSCSEHELLYMRTIINSRVRTKEIGVDLVYKVKFYPQKALTNGELVDYGVGIMSLLSGDTKFKDGSEPTHTVTFDGVTREFISIEPIKPSPPPSRVIKEHVEPI